MLADGLDDVVALERRHRDERDVGDIEPRGELAELVLDPLEDLLAPVDEIHLVDAHDDVRDVEQRGDERVAPRLLEQALARVDEHDRQGRRWTRR